MKKYTYEYSWYSDDSIYRNVTHYNNENEMISYTSENYQSNKLVEKYEYHGLDENEISNEYTYYKYEYYEDTNASADQVTMFWSLGNAIVSGDEVYVDISASEENINYIYGEGKYDTLLKTKENYQEYYIEGYGGFTGLKLNVTDVKAVYDNTYGQDINNTDIKYGLIVLHNDNTVSFITLADMIDGKVEAVELDTVHVVDVVTIDDMGMVTYLVGADGSMVNVNEYIK